MIQEPLPSWPTEPAEPEAISGFPIAIWHELLTRLSLGESLKKICTDDQMPHRNTVRKARRLSAWLDRQYLQAREDQADALADELIEIADGDGDARDKAVRIEARKWVASKQHRKRWGEHKHVEHSGGMNIDNMDAATKRKAAFEMMVQMGADEATAAKVTGWEPAEE